jgi:hypothetical protein
VQLVHGHLAFADSNQQLVIWREAAKRHSLFEPIQIAEHPMQLVLYRAGLLSR